MAHIANILQMNFIHLESSDKIYQFLLKKLNKKNSLVDQIKEIQCNISLENNRGAKLYRVTLETKMDHMGFIVKNKGREIMAILEQITDTFYDRLNKLADRKREKVITTDFANSTELLENEKTVKITDYDNYRMNSSSSIGEKQQEYNIVEKMEYPNNAPIHVDEAIQIMEKYNRPFLLFRNIRNGKYSVVYKVDGRQKKKNGYGLVEPSR